MGLPQRIKLRLKGYDYSSEGLYSVTICTKDREMYFENENTKNMITTVWNELSNKYNNIHIDEYIIMPNHIHGIIGIVGANLRVRPNDHKGSIHSGPTHRSAPTLGRIIQWFKTMTTNYYIKGVKDNGWPPFSGKLWQRNYYEHIVRDDAELNKIREYIRNNPMDWDNDSENIK